MGQSVYCRVHKGYFGTENDSEPTDTICPRCAKKHRLNNFYGLGIAILAEHITMGEPDGNSHNDENTADPGDGSQPDPPGLRKLRE